MTQVIQEIAEYVIAPFQDSVSSPATSSKRTLLRIKLNEQPINFVECEN